MRWYHLNKFFSPACRAAAIAGTILTAFGSKAAAQDFASVGNTWLTAEVGIQNQTNGIDNTGRIVVFDNLAKSYILPLPGQGFYLSPTKTLGSFVTVRIDGGATRQQMVNGSLVQTLLPGWDIIWGEAAGTPNSNGQTIAATWLGKPFPGNGHISASWATTPVAPAAPAPGIPSIEVDLDLTLVSDLICLKFTVKNLDTQAHSVALRFAQEYNILGASGPTAQAGPILLDSGRTITTESDLIAGLAPKWWRAVRPVSSSDSLTSSAGGILRPVNAEINAVFANELAFGALGAITGNTFAGNDWWDILPTNDPTFDFATNNNYGVAAATYFNGQTYAPGESKVLIYYFGRNNGAYDFARPWAASVQSTWPDSDPTAGGPRLPANSFQYDVASGKFSPTQVQVRASVTNETDTISLGPTQAMITLPPGLKLSAGETATKTDSGTILPRGEREFSWKIEPDGTASGHLNYTVSFVVGPGTQSKSVTRTIDVPALPTQTIPGVLKMVSFPYFFDDTDPATALGLQPTDFDIVRWNPQKSRYEVVSALQVGQGYWINMHSTQTVTLQNPHAVSTSVPSVDIPLELGWNQIGNPYLNAIPWSQVTVTSHDPLEPDFLKPLPIEQAADSAHNWILPTLWAYDPNTHSYTFSQDLTGEFTPFEGYWVKALKNNIFITVAPPLGRAARLPGRAAKPNNGPQSANNWKLHINASAGNTRDTSNVIGVAPNASDSWDANDLEKPPATQNGIQAGFAHTDWTTTRAGVYAQDIQAGNGSRKQWSLVVTSPQPNSEVTLSWPGVGTLPRGYELYVTDPSSGQRKPMRQVSSVTVNTGPAASRLITITAEPRGVGSLTINGLFASTNGRSNSSAISFSTSREAAVQVRIMRGSGEVVRSLATRAASAGAASIPWDNRDNRGVAVPGGTYIVEVKATTTDGTSVRAVTPLVVLR